jgi:hypothetical protein
MRNALQYRGKLASSWPIVSAEADAVAFITAVLEMESILKQKSTQGSPHLGAIRGMDQQAASQSS